MGLRGLGVSGLGVGLGVEGSVGFRVQGLGNP